MRIATGLRDFQWSQNDLFCLWSDWVRKDIYDDGD